MIELKPLNIVGVEPIEGPVALARELKKLYTDSNSKKKEKNDEKV